MKDTFFGWNVIYFGQENRIKMHIFETSECSSQIPYVIFKTTTQFLFKCESRNSSVLF